MLQAVLTVVLMGMQLFVEDNLIEGCVVLM
jgi:hypothetical protein